MLKAVAITLQEANQFVKEHHRHHQPVNRDKYRVGCMENGILLGIAQVGRPVSRFLDDGNTLEVLRLATIGTKNVCSFLYSRCARIAKELGYQKIITYILETESGDSLVASGWQLEAVNCGGGSWSRTTRPRNQTAPTCKKKRYAKILNIKIKDEEEI